MANNTYNIYETRKPSLYPGWDFWVMFVIAIIFLIGIISSCNAQNIDMNIIAQIESNNNPKAVNKISGASGMYQLMPIVVKEYNQYHVTSKMPFKAVFSPIEARIIANWYMNIRIPQYLNYYGLKDSLENRLICYNAGIGKLRKGILPLETINYIKKYKRLCSIK